MENLPMILGVVSLVSITLSVGISIGIMQTKLKVLEKAIYKSDKITYENEKKIIARDEEMKRIHRDIDNLSEKLISFDKNLIEISIKLTEILTRLNIEKNKGRC